MPKSRELITLAVVALTALLLGTGMGHWLTSGPNPSAKVVSTNPPVSTPPPRAIERTPGLSSGAPTSVEAAQEGDSSVTRKSLDEIMKGRGGVRTRELEDYVRSIAPGEIGAALKKLRGMPPGTARDLASGLLVARWVESDPDGALKFAAQNHEFDYITGDVFQQLAAEDAQAALARAQAIADPNARYQALRGVLSYMADLDPLAALELAKTLGTFANNEPLDQVIYRQWSAVDAQAAAAHAAQASNDAGWHSPVTQVLRTWASQDPLAAIAWSTSQTDPAMQEREIGQVIRQWSRDDPTAVANWVNSLDPGTIRDAAATSLAYSLGQSDPAAALNWAQSISDLNARNQALQRLSREIMYFNPGNGAAILQAAGIPQNMIPPPPAPGQGGGGRRGRP